MNNGSFQRPIGALFIRTVCVVTAIMILFAGISQAGTYYVSPTGSAAWQQCASINTPCSWQTAMAQAVADDIVYFRGGTYEVEAECGAWQDVAMNPANSGTLGHPITFIAYSGETATIRACIGDVTAAAFGAHDRSYIIWDGFHASMTGHAETAWLVYFYQATGSIIRNSHFTGVPFSEHFNNAPICIETSDSNEVYNNYIEGCSGTGTNTAGVWIFDSDNSKIYQNTITNCANGIMQKDGPNNGIEIYNNFIDVTEVGINLNEQVGAAGGLKVHNNIIINASLGINLDGISDLQTLNGYEVYNNTIYGGAMSLLESPYNRSLSLWNNLYIGPNVRFFVFHAGAALPEFSDYNGFYGNSVWNMGWSTNYTSLGDWRTATPYDDHSVVTDPGFVNAGGTAAADYKRTLYTTNGRGGIYAPIMGAYVTGNEVIGYHAGNIPAQNNPPSAPTIVSPANNQSGLGTTVEFRWKKSVDPDGDAVTYHLHNCTDQTFSACTPVDVAMNSRGIFFAGGAGLFMIGLTFLHGARGRRRIVLLLVVVVLFTGGTLVSCSKESSGNGAVITDEVVHTLSALSSGTTFYWKVVADDGKGGIAESEVRSYSTQ